MSGFEGAPIVRACRNCGQLKPLIDFQPDARARSGYGNSCLSCYANRSSQSRTKFVDNREITVPAGHRHCPGCSEIKPLAEFPRNERGPAGFGTYCKPCHNARGRASKERHGGTRNYHLKRRYRIGEQEFQGILLAQCGVCGICKAPNLEHVDHDHVTGQVRGILCLSCNGGLGHFKDNIATMRKAINYLEETSWQRVLVQPGVFRLRSPRRASLPSRNF
jgi:hypothetical protein